MELVNEIYDSINKYFSVLSHTGYKSYEEVNKLLVYSFFEELLNGPMSFYITEEDYNNIIGSLECLYGTCLIPYPNYKSSVDKPINNVLEKYKASDINVIRTAEDLDLRIEL